MPAYLCRLNPPRASFGADMTPDEMALMGEHAAHWRGSALWPRVLAFGPVADPRGFFGVAVVDAADEDAVRAVTDGDPVVVKGNGFAYDILAMPMGARP
jgi:uncharacterized protein YciI